jgi:site-specific DNA recombinase
MRGRKTKVVRERYCVGYCRVSTREQASDGHSLDTQKNQLAGLAATQERTLSRVFEDAGYSAGSLRRPAVQELLALIERGEIEAVYVSKLDRLVRSLADLLAIVKLCERQNVALVSASEQIDTGSPAGVMMLSMLGAFAEFERARISERIRDVSFDLRNSGHVYCRNVPFGYQRVERKTEDKVEHKLEPIASEQSALAVMRQMHDDGASYRQIAAWLTEHDIKPKGHAWYASSVRDVLGSKIAKESAAAAA